MKRLLVLFFLMLSTNLWAQLPDSLACLNGGANITNFKLYPTSNKWTFLKLDTRTGRIWQVQYSTQGDSYRFETPLNTMDLTAGSNTNPGRFQLTPTTNIWNFILMDCEDGRVWQVQWSLGRLHRSMWEIEPAPLPDYEIGDVIFLNGMKVKIVENHGGGYYRITPATEIKRKSWDEANDYCAALGDGWRLPTYEEYLVLANEETSRFWTCEVDQAKVFIYDPIGFVRTATTNKLLKLKIRPILDLYLH